MKPAINQWAFPKEMPVHDALSVARQAGFEAVELCVGEDQGLVSLDITEQDAAAIRKHADALGVALGTLACGLGWRYPLSSPDPRVREQAKEITTKALQIASWLEADSLLAVPGVVTPEVPYDIALEHALASVQELTAEAEKRRVALALENVWSGLLVSPVEFRDFIDQCESEYVGACFDTGNVLRYGYPEQWIRILGRRIKSVHAKDFRLEVGNRHGFAMLLHGDVNWPAVMDALRGTGYDGWLIAEYSPNPHSTEAMLRQCHAGLKAIIGL